MFFPYPPGDLPWGNNFITRQGLKTEVPEYVGNTYSEHLWWCPRGSWTFHVESRPTATLQYGCGGPTNTGVLTTTPRTFIPRKQEETDSNISKFTWMGRVEFAWLHFTVKSVLCLPFQDPILSPVRIAMSQTALLLHPGILSPGCQQPNPASLQAGRFATAIPYAAGRLYIHCTLGSLVYQKNSVSPW